MTTLLFPTKEKITFLCPNIKRSSVCFLLVWLVLALVQLIQHCPLPPSERPQAWCQLRYQSLTAGAPSLPQGRRAPCPHGFFICGSCRINVLFCLPRQEPWISIFLHYSLSRHGFVCEYVCLCLHVFLIFLNLSLLCLPSGNRILLCHFLKSFSFSSAFFLRMCVHFCHA